MITIDGSYGEGGGQIVRMSVALSAVTKKPVKIINVRAKRDNPGLSYQHITAINAVKELCNGKVNGLKKGAREIDFFPSEIKGGEYKFDVGTAGSVTLVLQCCLLPAIFADKEVKINIIGGTDVKYAPPVDYFKNVFFKLLSKINVNVELKLIRRGFYPKGGGEIEINIHPTNKIKNILFVEKNIARQIEGICYTSKLPEHVIERMKNSAIKKIYEYKKDFMIDIKSENIESISPGGGIVLWTDNLLGSTALAEKGVSAEKVGESAAEKLIEELSAGANIDIHTTDQILPYLSLAENNSLFLSREISMHAKTVMWVIKQFTNVDFDVQNIDNLKKVYVKVT